MTPIKPEPSLGLILFLIVIAVDVIVLFADLYLDQCKGYTISMYIRSGHPFWGIPIIGWQVLGILGMIEHLYF